MRAFAESIPISHAVISEPKLCAMLLADQLRRPAPHSTEIYLPRAISPRRCRVGVCSSSELPGIGIGGRFSKVHVWRDLNESFHRAERGMTATRLGFRCHVCGFRNMADIRHPTANAALPAYPSELLEPPAVVPVVRRGEKPVCVLLISTAHFNPTNQPCHIVEWISVHHVGSDAKRGALPTSTSSNVMEILDVSC